MAVFDWDGTAVPDRRADAHALTGLLEALLHAGLWIAPVTGTNINNLERQSLSLIAPAVRQRLLVCTNRGSEVFSYERDGSRRALYRRQATEVEEQQLTTAAEELQRRLGLAGVETRIIYDRLNRRKIDLIPLDEWEDPPKARIAELIAATTSRLVAAGLGSIGEVMALAAETGRSAGLEDPRVTSDGKYVEIGLTDKSDSIRWLITEIARPQGIDNGRILIGGDEFGDIGGFNGSDERMKTDAAEGAVFVSVGPEPNGVPEGILHVAGGPDRFLDILSWQLKLRRE